MANAPGSTDPIFQNLVGYTYARLPKKTQNPPERGLLKALASGPKTKDELAEKIANVAVNLGRLRKHLDVIFDKQLEGRRSFRRLQMLEPEGERQSYELVVTRNRHPVAQFWAGHGSMIDPTHLVWAEPLVFYDDTRGERTYVRYLDLNDPGNVPAKHPAHGLTPCYGYQSSGDIESVHLLEQEFRNQMIATKRHLIQGTTQDGVMGHHAIIIGNSRMNPDVRLHQQGFAFTVEKDHVKVNKKKADRLYDYAPTLAIKSRHAYVVLTRTRHHHKIKMLTMISGNQGRAVQRVVEALVDDESLEQVWNYLGADGDAWPSKFQLLFKVHVQRRGFVDHYEAAEPIDKIICPPEDN
jgi:hypothetical protein